MDEILQKIVGSELLSEETRTQLTEQVKLFKEELAKEVRAEVEQEVRVELAEQWVTQKNQLVDKIDTMIAEGLKAEIAELHEDIERFRDLEAEYAERLVEEKSRLATEVATELDSLVDKMDAFFEERIAAELEELREDLELARQNQHGMKMFEAFVSTYNKVYVDESSAQAKLNKAMAKLDEAKSEIAKRDATESRMLRESKLDKMLSALTGAKREQMALLLKDVPASKLEESYSKFIGRVLKEQAGTATLVEGVVQKTTTVITGEPAVVVESVQKPASVDRSFLSTFGGI